MEKKQMSNGPIDRGFAGFTENTIETVEKTVRMIPTGIHVFECRDGAVKLLLTNPAMVQMTGRSWKNGDGEEELYGVVHPDDRQKLKEAMRLLFSEAHAAEVTYRSYDEKNKNYRWILARGMSEETGEIQLGYVSYIDISDQKKAELELEQSRQRMAAAVENSGLEYWECDLQRNQAYIYEKGRKDYKLDKIIEDFPETWLKTGYVHPKDVEQYRRMFQKIKDGQPHAEWKARVRNAISGDYKWKRLRYTTVYDQERKPVYAVATGEDMNNYVELESRFIQTMIQNGLWVWDYDMKRRAIIKYNFVDERDPYGYEENIIENVPESIVSRGTIYEEDIETYMDLYRRIDRGERQVTAQVRGWNEAQKEYTWQELIFTVICDEDGEPVRALCSGRDISEKKQMEQHFYEENRYREEIAASMVATCRLNLSDKKVEEIIFRGVRQKLTEELEAAVDYRKRLEYFITDIELPGEENRQLGPEALIELYQKGKNEISADYIAKDIEKKSLLRIHVDCRLLKRPGTDDLIAFFYESDITQEFCLKGIMNSIMRYEYEMIGIIFAASNTIYSQTRMAQTAVTELKSNPYDIIEEAYLRERACTEDMDMLVDSLKLAGVLEKLETEDSYITKLSLREKDGKARKKEICYTYISRSEQLIAVSRRDIEDIVQAEKAKQEQLEEALNLAESANSAKSEFLARMSHEMRTPMNAIIGLLALARQEIGETDTVLNYLDNIEISGKHLMNLINDVLDMSKIESGELVLHPEATRFSELAKQAEAVIRPLCEQKKIRFEVEAAQSTECILADRVRFQQVLINLLSNAVKFTPEEGTIHFQYQGKRTGAQLEAEFLIRDNGVGMSGEFQKRMFRPFTQEEHDGMPMVQGTGLGLSISKAIIDKMGGTISASSRVGQGTTFKIQVTFEIADSADGIKAEPVSGKNYISHRLKEKKVLLVEDHPMNQLIAKRILQNNGIRVVTADNGLEGVELFGRQKEYGFDAVLMDIRMPGMDGLEAAKKIREMKRPDAGTVPIIAMTANAFDEDVEKTRTAGMNAHLAKPIEPELLLTTLEYWIEKMEAERIWNDTGLE